MTLIVEFFGSMVIIAPKNSTIRLCDEVTIYIYPVPNIDRTSCLILAMPRYSQSLMPKKDFVMSIKLDKSSSRLTTFNTPYRRF